MEVTSARSETMVLSDERKTPPPTTTISTIAVQSGKTKLVIALLQSNEWFQLKILNIQPQLTDLGETLVEAEELLAAHEEVLLQLESKQSPVEELLRQADQLISKQKPTPEVYAAMAESLGRAWKDVNGLLEERKEILKMNVNYKREEEECLKKLESLELICLDAPVPVEIEEVKQLLKKLHSSKKAMLESLMLMLQEGKKILEKLKNIAKEGTLDSRPDNIKANAERALSKVEHWLEALHDKRKLIEVIWQARKTQVEQCLALALLATELLEVEKILKLKKDALLRENDLGNSKADAKLLLKELSKTLTEAKVLQDRTLKITNSTEKLASAGHFAGQQAVSQSYAVLDNCAEYLTNIDRREEILDKALSFFEAAENAFNRLDTIEKRLATSELPTSSSALSKIHSELLDAMRESVEPAIKIGNEILDTTGRNTRGAEGVRNTIEQLNSRKINLEDLCNAKREMKLQASQMINQFLEHYNEYYSWLVTTVEAFLQGHQDMGSVLPMARDYLNVHAQLLNEFRVREPELKSFLSSLPRIKSQLDDDEENDLEDKVRLLQENWMKLRLQLENRIDLARTYLNFHLTADDLKQKYDMIDENFNFKRSVTDEDIQDLEDKCQSAQATYVQLSQIGTNFVEDSEKIMDQYLDVKRAGLCIKTILEQYAGRQSVVTDSRRKLHNRIDVRREVKFQWAKSMEDCNKTLDWVTKLQPQLYPILLEHYETCDDVIRELNRKEEVVIPEVKKAEAEIEKRIKAAEDLALKGEAVPEENKKVLTELLEVHETLQATLTEYQVLVQMILSFFRNLAEVEKTIENINKQNQVDQLSNNVQEIDSVIKEHEAYCQAVAELFKFTKTESQSIINKISTQEPEHVKQIDIDKIKQYLDKKQKNFETESTEKKFQFEQHRQLCQFDEDLQEINSSLSDLNDQLISIRGQYGESLPSAKATSAAFVHFEKTIELLKQRINTFIESGEDLLNTEHTSSLHIEKELNKMKVKWQDFHEEVKKSRRLIDLSIEYFQLIEQAEKWFKEGSKLLVTIARKTTAVRKPEEATELLNEVATFLKPGELKQDERIKQISELSGQLFGEEGSKHLHPVVTENREMVDSFTLIKEELNTLALKLKESEEEKERLKQEQKEIDASLTCVKAEALAAKAAAAAAEEARKAAELAAKVLKENIYTTRIEKVEIQEITSSIKTEKQSSPEKIETKDEVPPEFVLPLRNATVKEGEKFKFECKVIGKPTPEVKWFKENISVETNPDYQTHFDSENGICTLVIEETFAEDTATFMCKAKNSAGLAETSALLTIAETVVDEALTPPKFTQPLKSGTCKEGERYELSCFVEGYPLPTVQWFKGQTCVDSSSDYIITYNNGEAKLCFEQVFLEDQSEYTCKATNSVGSEKTSAFFKVEPLEPTAAPEIIRPLSNLMARAGQKIKLECEVYGLPEPEISWYRDGRLIKTNNDIIANYQDNIATLSLTETFPKDGGVYTMSAKNIAGEITSTCNVTVKGLLPTETSDSEAASDSEPTKPSILLELKDVSTVEGKTVLLECIIVGQPEPEVIWYHDGEPVKESEEILLLFQGDHCSLLINDVYLEDAGEYKVVAINSAGEATSSCNLSVSPAKAEDLKTDTEAEDGLEIVEVTESEEEKKIEGKEPKFTKELVDILAEEGDTIRFESNVLANPKPDIKWYLNNQLLEITENIQMDEDSDGNITLTLLNVTPKNEGVFMVKAINSFGESSCNAHLKVKEKPKIAEPEIQKEEEPQLELQKEEKSESDIRKAEESRSELQIKEESEPELQKEKESTLEIQPSEETNREPPVFLKKFEDITVKENEEVKFECTVKGKPTPEVKWMINDEEVSEEKAKISSDHDSHILVIPSVTKKESGSVSCVAENEAGRAVYTAKLNVRDSSLHKEFKLVPFIEPTVVTQTAMETSTFSSKRQVVMETTTNKTLSSSDSKEPLIEVHSITTKDQQSLKQVDQQPVEEIKSHESKEFHQINNETPIIKEDSTMTVSSGGQVMGELMKSNSLLMLGTKLGRKTTAPRFVSPVQGKIVNQGSDVELEGIIEGYPLPTVIWSKNGIEIEAVDNKIEISFELNHAKLKIFNADVKDAGRYCCKASNSVGTASCTSDLVVKKTIFPPVLGKRLQAQTVPKGERAKLEVEVTGTPEPTVTWYKDDIPIKSSDHFKIVVQGNSHVLVIEKASDEHSGRYMVKATNAGGLTQSIADLLVCETGPVESYSSITKIHDKIQAASQTKPEVVDTSTKMNSESFKQEKHSQSGESISLSETTKTQKIIRVKLEREPTPGLTLDDKPDELETKTEKIVTVHLPQEENTEEIDRTSIPKQSSLDFFKTKIKESKEEAMKELPKSKPTSTIYHSDCEETPVLPETFNKQSKIVSELKFVQNQERPQIAVDDAILRAQESYSMMSEEKTSISKSETVEKKIQPILKKTPTDLKLIMPTPAEIDLHPEPPPEIGFVSKTEKTRLYEDVSQKVKKLEEFNKVGSPVDAPSGGVRLLPIVFPKPETPKQPEVKEVKKNEEKIIETLPALSWLSDEVYSTEDKEVCYSTQSNKYTEQSYVPSSYSENLQKSVTTTQSTLSTLKDIRPTSPRPSAEGLAMEKLWASKKPYEDYKPLEDNSDTLKPCKIYRPPSNLEPMRPTSPRPSAEGVKMEKLWTPQKSNENQRPASSLGFISTSSPRPSDEGIAMDKIWAHKHKESNRKINWPPSQPQEEPTTLWTNTHGETRMWPPDQSSIENISSQKSSDSKMEKLIVREFKEINYPKGPEIKPLPPGVPVTHYIAEARLIRQTQSMDREIKYMTESSSNTSLQQQYLYSNNFSNQRTTDLKAPSLVKQISGPKFISSTETKPSFVAPSRILPSPIKPFKKEMKRSNSLDSKPFERFPDLEPFPFKPDPPRPKPAKCPPPPTPTKFVKCNHSESDYENYNESHISMKWRPYESDNEDFRFRPVKPPMETIQPRRPQSTQPEPLPPSKFENPPELKGPSRPFIDTFPAKKDFQRSTSETKEVKKKLIKVKTVSPPKTKPLSQPEYTQTRLKPEKMFPPESGYMADTDEPFFLKQKSENLTSKKTIFEDYSKKQEYSKTQITSQAEMFPYNQNVIKSTPKSKGPPPPTPSKFVKGEFHQSDYESDYECRIQPVWNSEGHAYKRVCPILSPSGRRLPQSTGPTPTPPTEFEIPPATETFVRPKFEPIAPETRLHSNNSLMLIKPKPVTPKVVKPEFILRPGSPPEIGFAPAYPKAVETSNVMSYQEDTETSKRVVNVQQTTRMISFEKKEQSNYQDSSYGKNLDSMHYNDSPFKKFKSVNTKFSKSDTKKPDLLLQPGEPPELLHTQIPISTATSYADRHIYDMTQTFKNKAQQFVSDVMTDTKKPDKPILKTTMQAKQNGTDKPHTYREESRLSERGTKHIDPDTGLIYFKYDFGYEFGIVLPGEGVKKSVHGGSKPPEKFIRRESIDFPIIHETTNKEDTGPNRPKKYTHLKSVKWEPLSESEISDAEDAQRKKIKGPQVSIPRNRWESTPSPLSISPMSSLSPKFQRSTPLDPTASPPWNRSGTPTSTTPNLTQKSIINQSKEPLIQPNFITPLRDIAVVSGQSARFECIVQAEPSPNVLWLKDGRILDNNQFYEIYYKNGVCRLIIKQANPADSGSYTCTATNMVGTADTTATLIVPGEKRGIRTNF